MLFHIDLSKKHLFQLDVEALHLQKCPVSDFRLPILKEPEGINTIGIFSSDLGIF